METGPRPAPIQKVDSEAPLEQAQSSALEPLKMPDFAMQQTPGAKPAEMTSVQPTPLVVEPPKPPEMILTQNPIPAERALVHQAPAPLAVEPADTAPPVVPGQVETPEQPQQIENERLTPQVMAELRRREDQRMHQRYEKRYEAIFGPNKFTRFLGKANRWLNSTNIGRAVKIGGKIVIGTSAAVTAGVLTGGIGLVAAPALFALGAKEGVDGAIEAGQYLVKGRKERGKLQTAKESYFTAAETLLNYTEDRLESGQITKEQFDAEIAKILEGIKDAEAVVTEQENQNIISEKHQQKIRGAISTAAAMVGAFAYGLPLGHQVFHGAGHAVRAGIHGINFIYGAGEAQAATVVTHLGGAVGHALGHAAPVLGKIGIAAAYLGLAAKTGLEFRKANLVGNKELVLPQVANQAEAEALPDSAAITTTTPEAPTTTPNPVVPPAPEPIIAPPPADSVAQVEPGQSAGELPEPSAEMVQSAAKEYAALEANPNRSVEDQKKLETIKSYAKQRKEIERRLRQMEADDQTQDPRYQMLKNQSEQLRRKAIVEVSSITNPVERTIAANRI